MERRFKVARHLCRTGVGLSFVLALVLGAQAQQVTTLTEEFYGNGGLTLGPDGYLYVGHWTGQVGHGIPETWGTLLHRVSMEGEVSEFADFGEHRAGLMGNAFGPDGLLYQSCAGANMVARVNADGQIANHADVAEPYGLVTMDNGDFYVVSQESAAASALTRITPGGETEAIVELPFAGFALAMDDEGSFYVSQVWSCNVSMVTPDKVVTNLGCPAEAQGVLGLSFANGRLYILARLSPWMGSSSAMFEWQPDGEMRLFAGNEALFGFGQVKNRILTGIASSISGDTLFVALTGMGRIMTATNQMRLYTTSIRMITGIHAAITAAEDERPAKGSFRLEPTYPNPVATAANIPFVLGETQHVRLELYDILGRRIRTLLEGVRPPGRHEIALIAANLPPGAYIVRLESDDVSQSRVMFVH